MSATDFDYCQFMSAKKTHGKIKSVAMACTYEVFLLKYSSLSNTSVSYFFFPIITYKVVKVNLKLKRKSIVLCSEFVCYNHI